MTDTTNKPTEEFSKVVIDFVNDIKVSFPEVTPLINRWFKGDSEFDYIDEIEERNKTILEHRKTTVEFLFTFCQKKFPPRFFDILYQNPEMFDDDSVLDTEFLPHIHFKTLWKLDITPKTRETIWKYLQLILFSIISTVDNREAFGDSAKLFDNINEDDFKDKLQEALNKMQDLFEKNETPGDANSDPSASSSKPNIPKADDIHEHLNHMLDGKIGKLAKEIAEETAAELNLDGENISDMQDVFGQLMKNPTKLMSLVKNVGTKLDSRIKSGELKESELIAEATDIMNNMKNMPGMDNIQSMLSKMGMSGLGGKGAKMNMGAMEAQMERQMKSAQMRERMKSKVGAKTSPAPPSQTTSSALTEEQLVQVFSTGEKVERTPKGQQPTQPVAPNSNNKKKGKKK
jgi:hypothetical protein